MYPKCFSLKSAFRTRLVHSRAHSNEHTRQNCLSLMRATAQSVSVITAVLPAQDGVSDVTTPQSPIHHGATLSSFTSVSMYPYPLVAFSLRTPSRMAESLRGSPGDPHASLKSHMVINLLSASQAHLALQFSRPHEFRHPFASTPYFLSEEGIPILHGCLGALSCTLIKSLPLGDIIPALSQKSDEDSPEENHIGQGSELFVARVLRVQSGFPPKSKLTEEQLTTKERAKNMLPLVYYRQRYVTVEHEKTILSQDTPASNFNRRTP